MPGTFRFSALPSESCTLVDDRFKPIVLFFWTFCMVA